MFVFGTNIRQSTIGTNPDLSNLIGTWDGKDIPMQIDFRRVYSDIIHDWFGAGIDKTNSLLFRSSARTLDFPTVSLFSNVVETIKTGNWADKTAWSVGRRPLATEYVKVNAGHTMTIDQNILVRNIRLEGKLQFTGPFTIRTTG